ncbi:MAG TPA: diguanylate cyclase response regulator, partial [Actinobacteria bacterium]|nr:diguanylate cyclase response regulator [Actinomycetota bacterium]
VENKFQISLSIGVEYYNADCHLPIDEIIVRADSLMYEEKRKKQIQ